MHFTLADESTISLCVLLIESQFEVNELFGYHKVVSEVDDTFLVDVLRPSNMASNVHLVSYEHLSSYCLSLNTKVLRFSSL